MIGAAALFAAALPVTTAHAQPRRPPSSTPAAGGGDDVDAKVRGHLERGVALFSERQYEAAIAEFEAGLALQTRPELLFALAQAERLSGDCASAVLYYRDFLASKPSERQAEAARANLERCENVLATSRARDDDESTKSPEVSAPVAPAPVAPAPPPAEIRIRRPWYTDVVGGVVLGAGVVAAGAGGYLWLRSTSSREAALEAPTYDQYRDHLDDARSERKLAIGALAVGGLLIAGAVHRYVTHGDHVERSTVALMPALMPVSDGGVGVALGADF